MKVLVIGGSGLVGRALQKLYPDYNYPPRSELDLLNLDSVLTYFQSYKPDIIVNLAAYVGGLYHNQSNNLDFLLLNTEMSLNLIKASKLYRPTKIINILSTCIFPSNADLPLNISSLHDGLPHESNLGYAFAKRWSDVAHYLYGELYPTTCIVTLIPTNLYGLDDNFNLETGHVLPALLHRFYIAKKFNHDKIYIKDNGQDLRQFLFAPDFAEIINNHILHGNTNVAHIIATSASIEISIKDLVYNIKDVTEFNGMIIFGEQDSGGQQLKTVRRPRLYGTRLQDGIRKVWNHLLQNYDKVRK